MEMGGLRKRPNEFPCKPSFLQGPQGGLRRATVQVPLLVKGTPVPGWLVKCTHPYVSVLISVL